MKSRDVSRERVVFRHVLETGAVGVRREISQYPFRDGQVLRLEGLEDESENYAFDHLLAARILSALVVEEMLQPERAARLIAFADRQEGALSLPEVLDAVLAKSWNAPRGAEPRLRSLQRVSERVVLDSLMILGAHDETTPEARAVAFETLERLGEDISERHDEDRVTEAHLRQAERDIAIGKYRGPLHGVPTGHVSAGC